jgi:hypothetical protein
MNKEKFPLNLIGNIEIVKKGENNRIVGGYANVAIVDSQKQFIEEANNYGNEVIVSDNWEQIFEFVNKL